MSSEHETKIKDLINEAMRARSLNESVRAVALCEEILAKLSPDDERFHWIVQMELGAVYLVQLHEASKAEVHYRVASSARPTAEWSSVGLFHALVEQDLWIAAMREVLRFVLLRDSVEYRSLLSDRFIRDLPDVARDLGRQAQEALARWC